MKKRAIMSIILMLAVTFSGCGTHGLSGTESLASEIIETPDSGTPVQETLETDASEMFTARDMEIGYDEETSVRITLSGDGASCESTAVQIAGSTVTIQDEGAYILSGALNNGMVIVDAEETDKIQLVLDGVEITSATSAAIYVLEADKVFITTVSGTDNILANAGEYVAIDGNSIDAVIFSKADLTLNGEGNLKITAAAGHGIVSKDDLVITSGSYEIDAASHGLSGKDSVRLASGTYNIVSGKDGIHAENADDASLGFLYIGGGTYHIEAEGDGMSAGTYLLIEDGEFTIESGDGSASAPVQSQNNGFARGGFEPAVETTAENLTSAKGLKAAMELTVNGGDFNIDAADDAIHSNGNLTVNGGSFKLASGDDGLHADSAVTINAGTIDISQSYEGIEGLSIDINGGDISLVASDDGLNAAGGNDSSGFGGRGGDIFARTEGAYINISGGKLHVNASGDGIDSNGSLTVTGGETYVSGPTDNGNGALDYAGDATISGGIFVAAGSSGMAQNFGDSSTQGVIMVAVDSGTAGSFITLSDSGGREMVSWQADKAYTSVIISCPDITEGAAYTLTTGAVSTQVTMESLIYEVGGMNGGMGIHGGLNGRGGMGGGRP